MTPTYTITALPSFYLFVDHELQSRRVAWLSQTGVLYPYTDAVTQLKAYGSAWPQWISDTSITTPTSGAYSGSSFVGRPDLHIDYANGRVLTSGSPASLTGTFVRKEIATYMNEGSEKVLIEKAWSAARQRYEKPQTYVPPGSIVAPLVNYSVLTTSNKGFAYGGQDETKTVISATILTDNRYRAVVLVDFFRDLNLRCFAQIGETDLPFNYYGDLKNVGWNYETLTAAADTQLHVDSVSCSNVSEVVNDQGAKFWLAGALVTVVAHRYPRQ